MQGAAKTAAERAIAAGKALLEAKELLKHGEWYQAAASALGLSLPGGNTGTKQITSSARRGGLPTCDVAA